MAARAHVRVARRLAELPVVRATFATGELSYSKVRALTRIATPSSETELVQVARHATAAHLDRIARARRSVDRLAEAEQTERRHEARHVHTFWDDDGSLVVTARLAPEEGALFLQALDAAGHSLRNQPPPLDAPAEAPEGQRGHNAPAGAPEGQRDDNAPAGAPEGQGGEIAHAGAPRGGGGSDGFERQTGLRAR